MGRGGLEGVAGAFAGNVHAEVAVVVGITNGLRFPSSRKRMFGQTDGGS